MERDDGIRYAMVKRPGDGVTTDYMINFVGGYLFKQDVYAYSYKGNDTNDQTEHTVTFLSESAQGAYVRVSPAPAVGWTLVIARRTQRADPLVDFKNRSMLTETNLNTITEQAIFSVAELEDAFKEQTLVIFGLAEGAQETADEALATAQSAEAKADVAVADAAASLTAAHAAETKADQAVAAVDGAYDAAELATEAANKATAAADAATALVGTIQGEVDAAVATANAASTKAEESAATALGLGDKIDAADTKAQTALTVANNVDAKAQSALDSAATANTAAAAAAAAASSANANANGRVSKAGDTMTGPLTTTTLTASIIRAEGAAASVWFNDRVTNGTYAWYSASGSARLAGGTQDGATTDLIIVSPVGNIKSRGRCYVVGGTAPGDYPTGRSAGLQCLDADNNARLFSYNYGAGARMAMIYEASGHFFEGGAVTSQGGFGPGSDPKLKQDLVPHEPVLDKLDLLDVQRGRYIDSYNDDGKVRSFLMADDVLAQLFPQTLLSLEHKGQDYRGWSADQLIAILVKAVQELHAEIKELKEDKNG